MGALPTSVGGVFVLELPMNYEEIRLARALGRFRRAVERLEAMAGRAEAVLDRPEAAAIEPGEIIDLAYRLDIATSVVINVPGIVSSIASARQWDQESE
ncbi:MAG: hypothetical protein NZP34_15485 [Caldilineales bacterium]|nr:hypothetical protein [Caldilineales bacterium]